MKRLIICADGTWDKPDQTDLDAPPKSRRRIWPLKPKKPLPAAAAAPPPPPGATGKKASQAPPPARKWKYRNSVWTRTPSNVVKVARAILPEARDGTPQIVYYDEGVGTGWDVIDRIWGGGFGLGISENILQCYRFLVENYSAGDEIYLFGFSRGAFTVRSLAGMIGRCGLLTKRDEYYIPEAYEQYRTQIYGSPEQLTGAVSGKVPAWLPAWIRKPILARLLERTQAINAKNQKKLELFRAGRDRRHRIDPTRLIPIKFIGVWDTVGALGIPIEGSLGNWLNRKYSFHDVRLGDHVQHAYQAVAIDEMRKPFKATLWDRERGRDQKVEQVWFTGYHANLGGGLRPDGLANIPLRWMIEKARETGLKFDQKYVNYYEKRIDLKPRNSMTLFWRLFGRWLRPIGATAHGYEFIHQSVFDRVKADPKNLEEGKPYQPRNLAEYRERKKKHK